ncbi:BTAD domain-containing putative transcriptional regulator [Streptomyces chartreusis]|uniref:BTAD domain-containing putative transcriptional regulator n=1 Tax=Streptomyces chartreusis TaxID=1969 RepID=UPI0036BF84AF
MTEEPEAWVTALSLAERAGTGDAAARHQIRDAVQRLCRDRELLSHSDPGRAVGQLTGLLDDLGEPEAAQSLVRQCVSRVTAKGTDAESRCASLNRIAVGLAAHGQLTAAKRVSTAASKMGTRRSHAEYMDLTITFANLATVELALDDARAAARSAERAAQFLRLAPVDNHDEAHLELRLRVASLMTAAARARNEHATADAHLDDLADLARGLVAGLGGQHPMSLSALMTLALAECESATAAGDRDRSERAVDVLLVAAQKAAASAGQRHPLAVSALRSLAAAEGLVALDSGDRERLVRAKALLATRVHAESRPPVRRQPGSAVAAAPPAFHLLGPVRARRAGATLPLASERERLLLAKLLLNEGRVVPTDDLMRAAWGDDFLVSPLRMLLFHMERLQRDLGSDVLVKEPSGYLIRLAPGSLDLHEARELVERSRGAQSREQTRELLNQALELWTGDPLEGLPGRYAREQRARLRDWYVELLGARLELDLELGRDHEGLINELADRIAESPQSHRFLELFESVLDHEDASAGASEDHAAARRILADALGAAPSASLRDLVRRLHEEETP